MACLSTYKRVCVDREMEGGERERRQREKERECARAKEREREKVRACVNEHTFETHQLSAGNQQEY
jgi:hypothetical protein